MNYYKYEKRTLHKSTFLFVVFIFSTIFIFSSCVPAKKNRSHVTGLEIVKQEEQYLDSKIISYKLIGIADTVISLLSGTVEESYVFKNKEFVDSMKACMIMLTNNRTGAGYNCFSDKKGFYKLYIPAGEYKIVFKSVGSNNIIIENVPFASGEIKLLNVQLALAGLTEKTKTFEVLPGDSLNEKKM